MNRRILAGLLLLALAGPLAAALTTSGSGPSCSMCSKRCCCAPRGASDPCSLNRPCGRDSEPWTAATWILEKNAVIANAEELLPPGGSDPAPSAATTLVLDPDRTPPDPPPRSSLQST